jgi:hypothetical protein
MELGDPGVSKQAETDLNMLVVMALTVIGCA